MSISLASGRIVGSAETKKEESGFGQWLASPTSPKSVTTETYTLSGKMTGACCEFELSVTRETEPNLVIRPLSSLSSLSILSPGPKRGIIVFDSDGQSATYVELSDGKLGKPDTIRRANPFI
jgi:hypothetical protein